MPTSYEPKFGRVLIKREIKKQIGSIILPDQQQKRHAACVGQIVGLGETAGWAEDPATRQYIQTLKVGDTVAFGRHSGAWLDATYGDKGQDNDDGSLFICQDADILAVIKE
jgi:co-chaperonin GroES (HSP10)